MSAELQRAIDGLAIRDVYLRELRASCFNNFDPKYAGNTDQLEMQSMHMVRRSEVVDLEGESHQVFRVLIRFGVRWVDPEKLEQDEKAAIKALVEAEFIAEYDITEQMPQECLDEFALKNAIYHVWPYWREQLMSQCDRMHLPRVVLPTMQVAFKGRKSRSTDVQVKGNNLA
jgi:hypothetical protein